MNNLLKREKRTLYLTKLIVLLLVVLLAATGLSSCKKKAPEEPQTQEEKEEGEVSGETEADEEAEAEEEKEPEADDEAETEEEEETEAADEARETPPIDEAGYYYSKDEVALYLHTYGHLPDNFITKKEAKKLGWTGGSVERYAPDMAIGGDVFGNYEGNLPDDKDQTYHECDIDTHGKKKRGAKRIIWSDDGAIYYTGDHYETFEVLYEAEG